MIELSCLLLPFRTLQHKCCVSCNDHHTTCAYLQWDASGETLAVLPAGCSFVYTWTAATRDLQKLETDFRVRHQQQEQQQEQQQQLLLCNSATGTASLQFARACDSND
jgi:hypothetical protein